MSDIIGDLKKMSKDMGDGGYLHDPKNSKRLETLYAVVSRDDKGNEGIVSGVMGGVALPFVFSEMKHLEMIRASAQKILKHTDKSMHVLKFKFIEEVEEIK